VFLQLVSGPQTHETTLWLTGDNLRISKSVSEIAQSVDIDFLDTLAKI
jgi:hypothetical protein